ncbi:ARABIDOPSIS THALIANA OVATE FAMILY PROTEIN 6, ovate family protein 6 [Hibiscus trionum]|uniref:Transcription repressor n=1 Tax=Hibiscus trionum TaxID=183268 RepID=A0A9W7JEX7_HIBTR|nr:ARABIDOPSIS THALIANA OVATE FAMILY PROTEIN 6, ovate family protein 6 [Hibiscus trionum]
MPSNKKNLFKSLLPANARCGCGNPKLFNVYEPKPKLSTSQNPSSSSSPSSSYKVTHSPCPKIVNSIAVVKDSDDPCRDFRHSMLQMIEEKHIYSTNELQELLRCFLELNSPCHHRVIVEAFMGIWLRIPTDHHKIT